MRSVVNTIEMNYIQWTPFKCITTDLREIVQLTGLCNNQKSLLFMK